MADENQRIHQTDRRRPQVKRIETNQHASGPCDGLSGWSTRPSRTINFNKPPIRLSEMPGKRAVTRLGHFHWLSVIVKKPPDVLPRQTPDAIDSATFLPSSGFDSRIRTPGVR